MLLTVSTVLDSRANVEHFVRSNLAMGIDHMVVFLDGPGAPGQREVRDWLETVPQVTAVPCDRSWWNGERPRSLNVRQRANANIVASILADQPWATWVFHLDGDEVFAGDRAVLETVPQETGAVWLTPLEAVSQLEPQGWPTRFKRLLEPDDLHLLEVLGMLSEPANRDYFHGHVKGKSGVRPSSGLRLTLHEAVHPDGQVAPRAEDPALAVLHYDAISGEEFIRKWTAMLGAGPAQYRQNRATVADALRALVGKDLSPEAARRYLLRIYETTTQDDVATLDELGLLVHRDPTQGTHRPEPLSAEQQAVLADGLARMAREPKRHFSIAAHAPRPPEPAPRWWERAGRRRDRDRG